MSSNGSQMDIESEDEETVLDDNSEVTESRGQDSDDDLESDSSSEEETQPSELPVTQEIQLDSYYLKDEQTGNRLATQHVSTVANSFHEQVLRYMAKRRQEQPISTPNVYPLGQPPPPRHEIRMQKAQRKAAEAKALNEQLLNNQPSTSKSEKNKPQLHKRQNTAVYQKMEIERKRQHPAALNEDILFNEYQQQNDGPFCKCYEEARNEGVIHYFYPGENPQPFCNMLSNNVDTLKHYQVLITPEFPFIRSRRTSIRFDSRTYVFQGFSLFFHKAAIENLPTKWLNRMFPEYSVQIIKAPPVEGFCIYELELFYEYFFKHLMELYDVDRGEKAGCPYFHLMPRFVCDEEKDGVTTNTLLPMTHVLNYLTANFTSLSKNPKGSVGKARRWLKGQLAACPNKKPSALRIDGIVDKHKLGVHIIHISQKPTAQSTFKRQQYFQAKRRYCSLKTRLNKDRKLPSEDMKAMEDAWDEMRKSKDDKYQRRQNDLQFPMRNFYSTGIYADLVQHAFFALTCSWRIRYHWSLTEFEERLGYKFQNRLFLELALTHPSNLTNYGTNSDHARNTLRNCGLRDIRNRKKAQKTQDFIRRKGVSTLMKIMAKFGSKEERQSSLHHNERLEFLGDAIVELLTSHHLFYMMPYAEEGVLASHRSKLVRNANLGLVGSRLEINKFLLHLHGPDLSHKEGMWKAMANAFEALMASIYLDSSIEECDRVLAHVFFSKSPDLFEKWTVLKEHPLKQNSPSDRHWIEKVKWLQDLNELEKFTGIFFHHIRVLARAFTRRQVGFNNLTQGHNQRLEFLGDTVLQFFVSDHLYRHFPRHQEGHLSLLRSCLVSNKTQSVICDDLKLTDYLFDLKKTSETTGKPMETLVESLSLKDKADLVESYLGAIFVDRGFDFCEVFCRICFFPRLHTFIRSSRWNDPKSQLQQCCLSLRRVTMSQSADIPEYRTVGIEGPTNTREYKVIVFFRNKRLASGIGHTIHSAELNAAENALIRNAHLFGMFNLDETYLGKRIREYDEKVDGMSHESRLLKIELEEEPGPSKRQRLDSDQTSDSNAKLSNGEEGELPGSPTPIKISSDEDSD